MGPVPGVLSLSSMWVGKTESFALSLRQNAQHEHYAIFDPAYERNEDWWALQNGMTALDGILWDAVKDADTLAEWHPDIIGADGYVAAVQRRGKLRALLIGLARFLITSSHSRLPYKFFTFLF